MSQHLSGSVVVLGTPVEESAVPNAGGKIPILDHGYLDGAGCRDFSRQAASRASKAQKALSCAAQVGRLQTLVGPPSPYP
jgi:hypothetical protein